MAVSGRHLFVAADSAGLVSLDVGHPAAPVVRSRFYDAGSVMALDLDGDLAYLVGWAGLSTVEISNLVSPRILGHIKEPTCPPFVSVAASGDHVLVGDWTPELGVAPSVLRVIDVSNPGLPRAVGRLGEKGIAEALDRVGAWAHIADRLFGLRIVDVSVPSRPVQTGLYEMGQGVALGVAVTPVGDVDHVQLGLGAIEMAVAET
jgi:hypothetical protein